MRVWRTADGAPVGELLAGGESPVLAVAAGTLPDGTPVIISGGGDVVRVWRLADSTPVGDPLAGHDILVTAVAAGTLPDGTPVIISGDLFGAVRVWRTSDGTPVGGPLTGHGGPLTGHGGPLTGHDGGVNAVAAGTLPDGTPVIISGGTDGTVRVWRTTDGTPIVPPLDLPESVRAVAVQGNVIITAAGPISVSTSQRSRGPCASCCSVSRDNDRPVK